jgi:fatty acid desaturase
LWAAGRDPQRGQFYRYRVADDQEDRMPAQTILIWLAIIWVGAALLGLALHIIKLLLIVALLASGVVLVLGIASKIGIVRWR